jgi:protoporphyrin/coproporphyrin ferrochelatase
MSFLREPAFDHSTPAQTAVLLINLGTPDEPTGPALKRYLREFLSDPRVVEIPKLVWWFILNGIILQLRPKKSAAKYAQVWTDEGSPLRVHTDKLTKLLKGSLGEAGVQVRVVSAMRYGNPSVASVLDELRAANCTRILCLPLYPQYAGATSATALDTVFERMTAIRNQPEIRTVRSFPGHPGYIAALEASVREHWAKNGFPDADYRLLMSFHGVPRRTLDLGDPYFCECQKTGRLLRSALGLSEQQMPLTFQSRFGKAEWLRPYTAPTLEALAKEGVKRVDVICPGFVGDCLETLEEIAMEGKESFLHAGGQTFHYIPCLNERADWVKAMHDLVLTHLGGWPVGKDELNLQQNSSRATLARAMGAKL